MDPKKSQKGDEWLDELNAVISENESDMFLRDGRLGWLRPYEMSAAEMIMPVRHPLYALSSHGITEEREERSAFTDMSSAFLAFLLYPVVTSVREMNFHPHELNVVVAGPAYLSRLAEGILYKVLKRMAFRRVVILNHAAALAMHFLRLPSVQKIGVLNMDENCLHVTRMEVVRDDEDVNVAHVSTRSVKELGWGAVRNEIAEAFYRDGLLLNRDEQVQVDMALSGLFGGMFSTNIPPDPGLRMTYRLLAEKLGGELGESLSYEASVNLMRATDELGLNDADFFVTSGSFFMSGGFENLMLNAVGKYQPARVQRILAMERTAYGIAEMLKWIGERQSRRITVQHNYSVRIASEQDSSIELVPTEVILPLKTGKKSLSVKQILGLDAEPGMERDLLVVDILWGNNLIPRYNTSLCTLSYDVTADDIRDDNMLELTFDLKGTSGGLRGEVTAALGGRKPKPPRKLHFPKSSDMTVLSGL